MQFHYTVPLIIQPNLFWEVWCHKPICTSGRECNKWWSTLVLIIGTLCQMLGCVMCPRVTLENRPGGINHARSFIWPFLTWLLRYATISNSDMRPWAYFDVTNSFAQAEIPQLVMSVYCRHCWPCTHVLTGSYYGEVVWDSKDSQNSDISFTLFCPYSPWPAQQSSDNQG
jgi:hypothetical protein